MQQQLYSMNLKLLLLLVTSSILVSGCSLMAPKERIVTQIQTVERQIPIQARPKGLSLFDVEWYVVTTENFDEFRERFEKENGDFVFYAVSVPGYENMSLNLAELRRYLEQQKALIVYYEEQLKPKPTEDTENAN